MKVDKNIPVPPLPKRAGRPATYPFIDMQVGDSFSIAPTAAKPDPVKRLKGTVSIANKKFAPKRFEIRRMDGLARVFRTV